MQDYQLVIVREVKLSKWRAFWFGMGLGSLFGVGKRIL